MLLYTFLRFQVIFEAWFLASMDKLKLSVNVNTISWAIVIYTIVIYVNFGQVMHLFSLENKNASSL